MNDQSSCNVVVCPRGRDDVACREGLEPRRNESTGTPQDGNGHKQLSVSIVALNSYGVLARNSGNGHIGGAEVQVVAFARGLAQRGHSVNFITLDHGQQDGAELDGIQVFTAFARDAGIPVLRFFWPRWTGVWAALNRAKPDVCLQACADSWTGITASWCHAHDRPFVFVAMNDGDCTKDLPVLTTRRDRMLYEYGVRQAASRVVQTKVQQALLNHHFGVDSIVLPPCCVTTVTDSAMTDDHTAVQSELLWIGRFVPEKRLEWFLDVAENLPDVICHVVGGANQTTKYSDTMLQRAQRIRNVTVHGPLAHSQVEALYDRVNLLVSTSAMEGFPTVFMEAWARGVPTVTTFDPDGVVATQELGRVAHDVPTLVEHIQYYVKSPDRRMQTSRHVREYFLHHHSPKATAVQLEALLFEVTKGKEPCNSIGDRI